MRTFNNSYSVWKTVALNNGFSIYYQALSIDSGLAWCGTPAFIYVCRIGIDDYADFNTTFPSRTTVASEDDAIALILGTTGVPAYESIATEKPSSSKTTFYTHDWANKCTWYQKAVRVVDEVPSVVTPLLVYDLANTHIIDTYHGLITGEDALTDSSGNSFRVVVKVNSVEQTEQDPHLGSGGDYTIDYVAGRITFTSALGAGATVEVTYHYADTASGGSEFRIVPAANKILKIEFVEVQFSADIVVTDTIRFQMYGYVDVFAPQLLTTASPPGPYPPGTQIPIGDPVVYKTMQDYMNDAVRAYPAYPQMGGVGWRGLVDDVHVFDWDYVSGTEMFANYGMELRISMDHDLAFTGSYATATFYGFSRDAT